MIGRRVGVEEEFFLVDPETGAMRPVSDRALRAEDGEQLPVTEQAQVEQELFLEQIETANVPCSTLAELEAGLREGRRAAAADAAVAGAEIVAVAAAPVTVHPAMTPSSRYQRMAERLRLTVRENLICGTHVHVEVQDDEEAVAAIDRIRPWLPVLLAASANSPFWHGEDTGYASFRAQVAGRWPSAGPTEPFGSAANYRAAVAELIRTTAALDEGMVYFDARLGVNYPTVEIRVADVCTEPADTVLIAALGRALVETAIAESGGVPAWRTEMLRAATWKASRWGLGQDLLDPLRRVPRPAFEVIAGLVDHVRPALDARDETDQVETLIDRLRTRGTGSVRQRAVYARRGRGEDVMRDAIERTRATYL